MLSGRSSLKAAGAPWLGRGKWDNFLGYHMLAGALLVITVDGAEKAQGFERLPKEQT